MEPKAPVMLLVLVETARLRWFVASVGLDGATAPLLRSEVDDLEKYLGLSFDEQVSFLRHRFCGVLQRGCDRLWGRNCKACQFVFVFEGLLPDATGTLTQAVAEHFTQWLLNPPAAVFNSPPGAPHPDALAGRLDGPLEELLRARLGGLLAAREDLGAWELAPKKGASPVT
jgi:hypothetical protein